MSVPESVPTEAWKWVLGRGVHGEGRVSGVLKVGEPENMERECKE